MIDQFLLVIVLQIERRKSNSFMRLQSEHSYLHNLNGAYCLTYPNLSISFLSLHMYIVDLTICTHDVYENEK